MTTDKDMEAIRKFYKKLLLNTTPFSDEPALTMLCEKIETIQRKSADQARKEAAERAVAFLKKEWYWFNDDACYADELRDDILGNSTADHIPDTGEKLAIAVKALEKINERHSFADIVDESYIISRDALKEIQG